MFYHFSTAPRWLSEQHRSRVWRFHGRPARRSNRSFSYVGRAFAQGTDRVFPVRPISSAGQTFTRDVTRKKAHGRCAARHLAPPLALRTLLTRGHAANDKIRGEA